MVETGFKELANRWLPILNEFDAQGVDLCYEIHPGEDLHDGLSFERFLNATGQHPRACILYDPSHFLLQQMDYLQFIDFYHQRIRAFHVKDAEFRPSGKAGVYGGYSRTKFDADDRDAKGHSDNRKLESSATRVPLLRACAMAANDDHVCSMIIRLALDRGVER